MDVVHENSIINDDHNRVQPILEPNSNVEGEVGLKKVYSNKGKKSVTNMRDFDAADLEKFPEIASMTKEQVRDNEQLWSEIQRNRARNRRQKSTLKLKADIADKEKAV